MNAFEPIIASALFRSFRHLTDACLNPFTGWAAAASVAAEAFANGSNVREVVLARGLMTEAELDDALRHEVLTQPRLYEKAQREG